MTYETLAVPSHASTVKDEDFLSLLAAANLTYPVGSKSHRQALNVWMRLQQCEAPAAKEET